MSRNASNNSLNENARLFHEAVVRSCDETLSRQKHEIRALKARIAELEAALNETIPEIRGASIKPPLGGCRG